MHKQAELRSMLSMKEGLQAQVTSPSGPSPPNWSPGYRRTLYRPAGLSRGVTQDTVLANHSPSRDLEHDYVLQAGPSLDLSANSYRQASPSRALKHDLVPSSRPLTGSGAGHCGHTTCSS